MNQMIKYSFLILMMTVFFAACNENDYADWKILNEEWLENHKNDEGFVQTESGLCYKIIHEGDIRYPNPGSYVEVKYSLNLIDGKVLESGTYARYLSGAIKGWQEGLRKIKGGGRCILYVPASLGYGEDGTSAVPPHSVLIFDVTLVRSID
jgi:FKBP-type peptidyl-prolyl cis-trans isomerase